jgi:hypothetical protein
VTYLRVVDPSAGHVQLSWLNPKSPTPTRVVVRRAPGKTAPATATSGSLVPLLGHPQTVIDRTAQAALYYSYSVFVQSPNRAMSRRASVTVLTLYPRPPPATQLAAVAQANSVTLRWTDPTASYLLGAVVRRSVGTAAPATTADGAAVGDSAPLRGTVTDSGLSPSTTYSWSVFENGLGGASSPISVTATTTPSTASPQPVTNLQGRASGLSVILHWQNPPDPAFAGTQIQRTPGTTPATSPTDGTPVATTGPSDTSFTDNAIRDDTRYTYTVFSRNNLGEYSSPVSVSVMVQTEPGVKDECGEINKDQTWSPSEAAVYELSCDVTVDAGVTLVIAAGTIVKADVNVGLIIQGNLSSPGTANAPVLFTSVRDDFVGGDSNHDGSDSSPSAGDWKGVTLTSERLPNATATLNFGNLRYAGIAGSHADVTVRNTEITHTPSAALDVLYGGADIEGNTVDDAGGAGIRAAEGVPSPAVTIKNNTVSHASGPAISVNADLYPSQLSGNNGEHDAPTGLVASGVLDADLTLPVPGLPWIVGPDPVDESGIAVGDTGLLVPSGVTLTMQPGAVLKVDRFSNNYPGLLTIDGKLVGLGTPLAPVTITALSDDSVGGDTNGDGSATRPSPGAWGGIVIGNLPDNNHDETGDVTLQNAIVDFGGLVASRIHTLALDRVTVEHVADTAIDVYTDNGAGVSIRDCTVNGAGGSGVEINATYSNGRTDPLVVDNEIDNVTGPAVHIRSLGLRPLDFSGNRGVGDTMPVMELGGELVADLTVPYLASGLVVVPRDLTVDPGATLTVSPGTVLKLVGVFNLRGSLMAVGSQVAPIVLTSINDNSVGLDLNGGGSASVPHENDWSGVTMARWVGDPPAPVDLTYTTITYGEHGVDGGGLLTLRHDTIAKQATFGVRASAWTGTGVDIESTTVMGNTDRFSAPDDFGIELISSVGLMATPTLVDNVVNDTTGTAFILSTMDIDTTRIHGNTGTGNRVNAIEVSGDLRSDLTLGPSDLPWVINAADYDTDGFIIEPGATLTLLAGTVLKVARVVGVPFDATITVEGSLVARGSQSAPVAITSFFDDSVGGDTNGDGVRTAPHSGDWGNLATTVPASNPSITPVLDLQHTLVAYSRGIQTAAPVYLTIKDDTIAHTVDDGIFVWLASSGTVDIESSQVLDSRRDGIRVEGRPLTASPVIIPTVSGNFVSGCQVAIMVRTPSLASTQLANNSGAGNIVNAIEVSGTLIDHLTLPQPGLPWAVANDDLFLGLTISSSATMTLHPGAVLAFDIGLSGYPSGTYAASLVVNGRLEADGTPENPAVFTSLLDNVANPGITPFGVNRRSQPAPDDWMDIEVGDPLDQPVIDLQNVTIKYAMRALTAYSAGAVSVTGTIEQDVAGVAGPAPDVSGACPAAVDARHVFWGTPSGPAPYGSGPAVTGCVLVEPWVGET